MNQTTIQGDGKTANEPPAPRDRALNPWRVPLTQKARALVNIVRTLVDEYETTNHPRTRTRTEEELQNFAWLIGAVILDAAYHRVAQQHMAIRIPRNTNALLSTRYLPAFVTTKTLPRLVDWLADLKLIEQNKQLPGAPTAFGRRNQSTMKAADKLAALILQIGVALQDIGSNYERQEIVVVKEGKDDEENPGGLVEYVDDERTTSLRLEVKDINEWLAKADLQLGPTRQAYEYNGAVDVRERHLKRIFTCGDTYHGGRLFGGFWQHMKKAHRRESVLINLMYTTELDFSSMMPRLLYGMAKVSIPKELEHDLYAIPGYERSRDGIKKVFNAMVFGKNPKRWKKYPKESEGLFHPEERRPIQDVVKAITKAHYPVSLYFGTRVGHTLQNVESNILVAILLTLKRRGVVALPVHDALIVAYEDAPEVQAVMLKVFRELAGIEGRVGQH